jgi:hypothetical protein
VSPSGEYFVGGVEASEFATFELTAQTDSNASSVPVVITYIVDNERVTTTQQVDLTAAGTSAAVSAPPDDGATSGGDASSPRSEATGSGGLPLGLLAGGAAVITILLAGVAYRWRSK